MNMGRRRNRGKGHRPKQEKFLVSYEATWEGEILIPAASELEAMEIVEAFLNVEHGEKAIADHVLGGPTLVDAYEARPEISNGRKATKERRGVRIVTRYTSEDDDDGMVEGGVPEAYYDGNGKEIPLVNQNPAPSKKVYGVTEAEVAL